MARPYALRNTAPPGQIRQRNGQDQYAPDRGVGGFQEFDPFWNACANFCVLRSSVWRPLAGRFVGLLKVTLDVVELSWWFLGSILEVSSEASWTFVLVPYQHGRARGTKSRLRKLCLLAPPLPGQSSTSPLGEGEFWFGRGALCNARGAEIRIHGSSVCF